jgi:pimeloyl-ACP methyl ester carboxylesterase
MLSYRKHGKPPFNVILIHGGPGALGDLYPLAKDIGSATGVIEALQTKQSIDELIIELDELIVNQSADNEIILAGHSWGAWLAYIYAARYPGKISKLILISSGAFVEYYANELIGVRAKRLSAEQRTKLTVLMNSLNQEVKKQKQDTLFKEIGEMFSDVDSYNPLNVQNPENKPDYLMYKSIWYEATEMRRSGALYALGTSVVCPVTIIHGDYDPHPVNGVAEPLFQMHDDVQLYILEKCGHTPWKEIFARERFLQILEQEISI